MCYYHMVGVIRLNGYRDTSNKRGTQISWLQTSLY